ncbi:NAD-dependent epimerase/dehydratase family protein [Streptomyces sp. NPDC003007]
MKVLVTGGSGFLGREICRRLRARGDVVSSLCRRPSTALEELDVQQHVGDLADPAAVARAVAGCDAVVHNAALAGVSGPPRPYWATNVVGTRHVIEQCRVHGVRTLLYTSTASVAFRPGGLEGVDESLPHAPCHLAAYPATKARAEALVLAAHGPELATVSLRPHIIWGPGDPHFVPALARAVRVGRLPMPGDGSNLVDTTHVRTAAHAHLLALDRLRQSPEQAGGHAYFIGQDDARPLREITRHFLRAAGLDARWCPAAPARDRRSRRRRSAPARGTEHPHPRPEPLPRRGTAPSALLRPHRRPPRPRLRAADRIRRRHRRTHPVRPRPPLTTARKRRSGHPHHRPFHPDQRLPRP